MNRLAPLSLLISPLPYFSWSLSLASSTPPSQPTARHRPFHEACQPATTQDFRTYIATQATQHSKTLFLMGEHHHQTSVLAAQLTMLSTLIELASARQRKVVLVMEQFNILQQGLLDGFLDDLRRAEEPLQMENLAEEFMGTYERESEEGFGLLHYMPLFVLAKDHDVVVRAGFPPKPWARQVAKEGIPSARDADLFRANALGFDRWEDLTSTTSHRAFLKSLMSEEAPTLDECLEDGASPQKGIYPAQCFKDAVMAKVIDDVVATHPEGVLIMVVAGSGHCEYGFGVPERVRSVPRQRMAVVVAKSYEESRVWVGEGWSVRSEVGDDRRVADAVFMYHQA